MKLHELFEDQQPAGNAQQSAYDQLLPYKNDPAIFLTLSQSTKIERGTVSADAPSGIAAFSLKDAWAKYDVEKAHNFDRLPYVNKRPYIHVLKYPHPILATDRYNNLDHDVKVLKSRYSHLVKLDDELQRIGYKHPFQEFWQLTKYIAKELNPSAPRQQWAKILRALNYSGFIDTNNWINDREPGEVFLLKKDGMLLMDTIYNKEFESRKSELEDIRTVAELEKALSDKNNSARTILRSIDGELCARAQDLLERNASEHKLYEYLHSRNDTDVKLLLLVWLNGTVDFNNVQVNLESLFHKHLNVKPAVLLDYAKRTVKFPWNSDVLVHNLELFKAKAG